MAGTAQGANLAGKRLGHYVLVEEIGAGAMGRVFKARDQRLQRDVAIKILPPRSLADPEARKRFRREALALSKLNHPNIATIHDFDTADPLQTEEDLSEEPSLRQQGESDAPKGHGGELDFLVMEYVQGQGLDEMLAAGPLPEKTIAWLGQQLAEGLAVAHRAGVLHRDLKPANLRVTEDGRLKILDFGLAKLEMPANYMATTATGSQQFVGTFPYMAPEQLLGEKLDPRTDIYAAGNVLYEMATGVRPFAEEQGSRLVEAILHLEPPPPRARNGRISSELEYTILKCLEKAPENRYQSASELGVDLRRLAIRASSGKGGARSPGDASASGQTRDDALLPNAHEHAEYAPDAARPGPAAPRENRRLKQTLVAIAILVVALGAWFGIPALRNAAGWGKRSAGAHKIESLAVLPLENLSGDASQEYFADGMTDELINRLARIAGLRVISRTSIMRYKGAQKALPEIARELNVDAVVEGSVARAGDRVRITAELIDAARDQELWGDSYNRDLHDVLALQDDVAEAISNHIGHLITGRSASQQSPRKVDPSVYQAYLLGRYEWNRRTSEATRSALQDFERAIATDPTYAPAYSGLADCYVTLWLTTGGMARAEAVADARAAAEKALELDPSLADAHTTLGILNLYADWNWAGAELEFKRALELDPNYATAHHWYGLYLAFRGRREEARQQLELAHQLDPLSAIIQLNLGWVQFVAGNGEALARESKLVLDREPDFWDAHWDLGTAYVQQGQFTEGIAELRSAAKLAHNSTATLSSLGYALARAGEVQAAAKLLQKLRQTPQTAATPEEVAMIYVGLGKNDEALRWLEKAYPAHSKGLLLLYADPWYRPLASDPRFQELLREVGLPTT